MLLVLIQPFVVRCKKIRYKNPSHYHGMVLFRNGLLIKIILLLRTPLCCIMPIDATRYNYYIDILHLVKLFYCYCSFFFNVGQLALVWFAVYYVFEYQDICSKKHEQRQIICWKIFTFLVRMSTVNSCCPELDKCGFFQAKWRRLQTNF